MMQSFLSNKLFFLLLITLVFFTQSAFSESAILINYDGNVVVPGTWSKYSYGWSEWSSSFDEIKSVYTIPYLDGWKYSDLNKAMFDGLKSMTDNNFFKCDANAYNSQGGWAWDFSGYTVDVLSGENIRASYSQQLMHSANEGGNPNSASVCKLFDSNANSSTWLTIPYGREAKEYRQYYYGTTPFNDFSVAQPNNISGDYDCDQNKFWIQFYLDESHKSSKLMCEDDPSKLDTCVKDFTATASGVWQVRFGSGVVYESIACSNLGTNTASISRKWGINEWDINVLKTDGSIATGRVWRSSWPIITVGQDTVGRGMDMNFFVLAPAIGNNATKCKLWTSLYGQESWSDCFAESFKISLFDSRFNWTSVISNDSGLTILRVDNKSSGQPGYAYTTRNSVPTAGNFRELLDMSKYDYMYDPSNKTKYSLISNYILNNEVINSAKNDFGIDDYNGCAPAFYWDERGYYERYPSITSAATQRLYLNEPEFIKLPKKQTVSSYITQPYPDANYIFNIDVGDNLTRYYEIIIDLDEDGNFSGLGDSRDKTLLGLVSTQAKVQWDLTDKQGRKVAFKDYNYSLRVYSSNFNVQIYRANRVNLYVSKKDPNTGIWKRSTLFWDDSIAGGTVNFDGNGVHSWNGAISDSNCSWPNYFNYQCFCFDLVNRKIKNFYDLNQSIGYLDIMNSWAIGELLESKKVLAVVPIKNNVLSLTAKATDKDTLQIEASCTYNSYATDVNAPIIKLFDSSTNKELALDLISGINRQCKSSGSTIIANLLTSEFENNKIYKVTLDLNEECSICRKDAYFTFTQIDTSPKSIPDNNLIGLLLVFSFVVFFTLRKRIYS